MIRVRQVKVDINNGDLIKSISKKLNIKSSDIKEYKINKRSIDARHKPDIYYVYEVDVALDNEDKYLNKSIDIIKTPIEKYTYSITGSIKAKNICVVGMGPAGLFCAYNLVKNGYKVTLIERGEKVEDRINTVSNFWNNGVLNKESNIQFGEGGAGTFSDGKLGTLISDSSYRMKEVYETFVKFGADESILYDNKPHVGTDILSKVVLNIRNEILSYGGKILFNTKLTDIIISDNKVKSIIVNNKDIIDVDALVLAIGHSSRDTFKMLYSKGLNMSNKPFAIGFRVMHDQELINNSQYGINYNRALPNASYKLTYKDKITNKGVFSFCMCPGGYVVNASSEENKLTVNGMSYSKRDSGTSNSAIVVSISKDDFGEGVFDGMYFQESLEEKAFNLCNGPIPVQNILDYMNNNKTNKLCLDVKIKGNYQIADLNNILPIKLNTIIKRGITNFDTKINGFIDKGVIVGLEARTSSPVRIIRDECMESNIKGVYPVGEGAGYAGGITSAAIDGLKAFEEIIKIYKP